jgi:hypothetical protein
MTNAYNYYKDYKIMTEDSYPYTERSGKCKYNANKGIANTVGFKNLP